MSKIKWKYYKDSKEWAETNYYPEDRFLIKKGNIVYFLTEGYFKSIGSFKKLSSAKQVAELLRNG